MSSYLYILGRQPELGLAELECLLGPKQLAPFGRTSAISDRKIELGRLGGSQKLGRVIYRGPARDINEAPIDLSPLVKKSGKTTFGLSYYGLRATNRFVVKAGATMKKRLKTTGSVRFVAPSQGLALTAAQVKFNSLLRGGFELLIVVDQQQMVVAVTEDIQDIDWYAARDYARPTRSAKVGMLPPKLAQVMVNTTVSDLVFDPFCGTGVVLQEALLLGRQAGGSDLSLDMVAASQDNLKWLGTKVHDLKSWTVTQGDALSIKLPPDCAIVSEGYLGPNQSSKPTLSAIKPIKNQLLELYTGALASWQGQLKAGSQITITCPAWNSQKGLVGLGLVDRLPDLGYTLKRFKHVPSDSLIYRRPDQFVGRQLLVMTINPPRS